MKMGQSYWVYLLVGTCLTHHLFTSSAASVKSPVERDTNTFHPKGRFNSARARDFLVNGKTLPLIPFDIGDSYSGLLPTSKDPKSKTELFFWFLPSQTEAGANDLALFSNGGPGCSSFIAATSENGPFFWDKKTTRNPHSWNQAANMLYIEHPAPVGFSEGVTIYNNEIDVARAIFGFLQEFLEVFPELKNMKFWVTGESYAGYYIPYLSKYIYDHHSELALNLQGTLMIDPLFAAGVLQFEVPAYPFVKRYSDAFKFNATLMSHLAELHHSCGFDAYLEKYLRYPPPGPFKEPPPGSLESDDYNKTCEIYGVITPALDKIKDFDFYNIYTRDNHSDDIIDDERWFNRADVQSALHVPKHHAKWSECTGSTNIFPKGDSSDPPAWEVYPRVIEKSKRSILAHGLWDFRLFSEGAKLAVQNMTWNGSQGLSQPVTVPLMVEGQGQLGRFRTERDFTFIEVNKAGHMIPMDQPRAALQMFQFLLGQRDSPSI